MKNAVMRRMTLAAALALPGLAAAQSSESLSKEQQKALSEAQAEAGRILGEKRTDSGAGKVLSVLYQELFNLKDKRRAYASDLVKKGQEVKWGIRGIRSHAASDEESQRRAAEMTDEEIIQWIKGKGTLFKIEEFGSAYFRDKVKAIRSSLDEIEVLELEKGLLEQDIKDLEARIKDLTDRLVQEEKEKK